MSLRNYELALYILMICSKKYYFPPQFCFFFTVCSLQCVRVLNSVDELHDNFEKTNAGKKGLID